LLQQPHRDDPLADIQPGGTGELELRPVVRLLGGQEGQTFLRIASQQLGVDLFARASRGKQDEIVQLVGGDACRDVAGHEGPALGVDADGLAIQRLLAQLVGPPVLHAGQGLAGAGDQLIERLVGRGL
jgi:hypothetical protein